MSENEENGRDYSLGSEVQDAVAAKEGLAVETPGVNSGRMER